MDFLFLCKDFPGRFNHFIKFLTKNKKNNIVFITNDDKNEIPYVKKLVYHINKQIPQNHHIYLQEHETAMLHAQAAAEIARKINLKNEHFDIICTEAFSAGLLFKYMFKETPVVVFSDWYNRTNAADMAFEGKGFDINYKAQLRCSNSCTLMDLYADEAFVVASEWQKAQFPKEFYNKIHVIPDEIDTNFFKPDENAKFMNFGKNDEIITYTQRGLEPYHGFLQFMQSMEKVLKERKNAHVIIAGEDKVYYRAERFLPKCKDAVMSGIDIDLDRVHFVGKLPLKEYLNLLQISSAHVHLTYPYIPSRSILNAMAAGCCVIASNTEPVLEIAKDNYNALLADFFDIENITDKINFALDNPEKIQSIRINARKTIEEKFKSENTSAKQFELLQKICKGEGN